MATKSWVPKILHCKEQKIDLEEIIKQNIILLSVLNLLSNNKRYKNRQKLQKLVNNVQ